ncbi:hypothetical protein HYC85_009667 [Camellia sinensis]|uniref:Uncharacterized protein n=1 Tax=Camellia sinensis TaxID=4442 RepID=A0A7J7HFL9_CAMSI|nr:hypothetical protein HYC85_009667 [Camellia sinensis]
MKSYKDDDNFEFPCVCEDPTSVDEIFYNGQIRHAFSIFGRDLLFSDVENFKGEVNSSKPPSPSPIQIPLGKLMSEDRDPPLCSSSEADKLDKVPEGTYCAWKLKYDRSAVAESPQRCKKSSLTGIIKAVEVLLSSLPEQQRRQGHLRLFRSFECQFEEEAQQEVLRERNKSKSHRKSEADGGRRRSDNGTRGRLEAVVDAV